MEQNGNENQQKKSAILSQVPKGEDDAQQVSYERSSQAHRMTVPPKLFDLRQDNVDNRRMAVQVN